MTTIYSLSCTYISYPTNLILYYFKQWDKNFNNVRKLGCTHLSNCFAENKIILDGIIVESNFVETWEFLYKTKMDWGWEFNNSVDLLNDSFLFNVDSVIFSFVIVPLHCPNNIQYGALLEDVDRICVPQSTVFWFCFPI